MTKDTAKSSRVTNVQVPGEQPKPANLNTDKPAETANTGAALAGDAAGVGGKTTVTLPDDVSQKLQSLVGGETDAARTVITGGAGPAVDLEAMRAQIREEERAIIRAEERDNARIELGRSIQAASTVIGGTAAPARSKADYRTMRAADIDPATLTAPVMTLDGYLCPPAPEAKK